MDAEKEKAYLDKIDSLERAVSRLEEEASEYDSQVEELEEQIEDLMVTIAKVKEFIRGMDLIF